jgi:large subunit ribosomal protein L19e
MNLKKKKQLAAKVLNIGKNKIRFNLDSLSEIKEAITKQDIRDLYKDKAILINPAKGKKKIEKRKTRKGFGKIKKKIKNRKRTYVKATRKLRAYLSQLKKQGRINNELFLELRKKIKMRYFRSKMHLKEYLMEIKAFNADIKNQESEKVKKKTAKNQQKTKIPGEKKE